jgi:hypothetical protein
MSITIRKTFEVASVPTDVTSFTLGVVRDDNDASVVTAGTAMTKIDTGVYEYTFTAPAAGLTYTATYVITATNGSVYTLADTIADTAEAVTTIALPELTGDALLDTYNTLLTQRLQMLRDKPQVSYNLHGHRVSLQEYMEYLNKAIMDTKKELAQRDAVEEIGVVW